MFAHHPDHLTGLGVAERLQLGIQQITVGAHLEAASVGGHQGERLDLGFELVQQLCRQTGGAIGIVSDSAVYDLDFKQHLSLPLRNRMCRLRPEGPSPEGISRILYLDKPFWLDLSCPSCVSLLNNNPAGGTTGWVEPVSLGSGTVRGKPYTYTFCLDNGGSSGAGYSADAFHPAALRSIQRQRTGGILNSRRSLCRRIGAYSSSSQLFA